MENRIGIAWRRARRVRPAFALANLVAASLAFLVRCSGIDDDER